MDRKRGPRQPQGIIDLGEKTYRLLQFEGNLETDRYELVVHGELVDDDPVENLTGHRLNEGVDESISFHVVRGDVDGNGRASITDVILVARSKNAEPTSITRDNLNGSSQVDATDIVLARAYLGDELPPLFARALAGHSALGRLELRPTNFDGEESPDDSVKRPQMKFRPRAAVADSPKLVALLLRHASFPGKSFIAMIRIFLIFVAFVSLSRNAEVSGGVVLHITPTGNSFSGQVFNFELGATADTDTTILGWQASIQIERISGTGTVSFVSASEIAGGVFGANGDMGFRLADQNFSDDSITASDADLTSFVGGVVPGVGNTDLAQLTLVASSDAEGEFRCGFLNRNMFRSEFTDAAILQENFLNPTSVLAEFSVTAVPEPSSLTLLAVALLVVGALQRIRPWFWKI